MEYKPVLAFLECVAERWQEIARELGLSEQTIHRIHEAHQGNCELCCQQMIEECLIGTEVKMRWHSVIKVLRKLRIESLAENIDFDWGKQIYVTPSTYILFKSLLLNIQATMQGYKLCCWMRNQHF